MSEPDGPASNVMLNVCCTCFGVHGKPPHSHNSKKSRTCVGDGDGSPTFRWFFSHQPERVALDRRAGRFHLHRMLQRGGRKASDPVAPRFPVAWVRLDNRPVRRCQRFGAFQCQARSTNCHRRRVTSHSSTELVSTNGLNPLDFSLSIGSCPRTNNIGKR